MNHHYADILSRIPEEPLWFDEHAVPRYEPFTPDSVANVYADECVLLLIACQRCGHQFKVAVASSRHQICARPGPKRTLAEAIRAGEVGWGDPPNVNCCPAGPTMSSDTLKILEYWRRDELADWQRDSSLQLDFSGT